MVFERETHKAKPGKTVLISVLRVNEKEIEIKRHKSTELEGAFVEKLTDFSNSQFPSSSRDLCRSAVTKYSDYIYVATSKATGEIIGIAGEKTAESVKDFTYFSTAGVVESERGTGLYQELVYQRIIGALTNNSTIIKTDTQNAKVEYGIRKVLERLITEGRIKGYNITRTIRQGEYGSAGPLAGSASLKSRDENLNKEYEILDKNNGDAFRLTIVLIV